jgi:hypothetical protein
MKLAYEPDGTPRITAYDRGDLVRLMRDQRGGAAAGKAGDWGEVEHRSALGLLTIRIAGHSEPRHSTIMRLSDVPPSIVQPCNRRGVPTPPKPLYVRSPRRDAARPRPPARAAGRRPLAILFVAVLVAGVGTALQAK